MCTPLIVKFIVIGIQILVSIEGHDANPRIGVLRQNRAVIGNDITKSICVINLGDIIEPCLMVIGITPHVDSALGGAGRVDIVAEALYVIDGGLAGLVDIAIVDIDGKGCSLFIPCTTALNVNQAIIVVILNSNRRGTNCKCRVVELQTRRIGREFIACPRFKREREVANDAFV